MCVIGVQLLFFSILILVHIGLNFQPISLDNILTGPIHILRYNASRPDIPHLS
jgi:hypothetical protein